MTSTDTVTEKISLSPHELSDIYKNIVDKVNENNKICTKERGYVTAIKIISYNTNMISRTTGNCIFNVTYNVTYVKPEVGAIYNALVTYIFENGIILKYKHIDIIIPTVTLNCYQYRSDMEDFFEPNTAHIISVGCWLKVKVEAVEYENHMYKCVASLFKEVS